MERDFWGILSEAFPKTSQKLVECLFGCWGDGECVADKSGLEKRSLGCNMTNEDLRKILLVRRYVQTGLVGEGEPRHG